MEDIKYLKEDSKRYGLDPEKIKTFNDIKTILVGLNFVVTGESYFEDNPALKKYFKEREQINFLSDSE